MQLSIVPEIKGVYIKLKGVLTVQDIIKAFNEMINYPEYKPGYNVLWDLTEATYPDMAIEDIKTLGAAILKIQDKRGIGKSAWVVHTDIDFGLARMFEMLMDREFRFMFKSFRDVVEAKLWIMSDESRGEKVTQKQAVHKK